MKKEPLIYTVETDKRLILRISKDGKVMDFPLSEIQIFSILRGIVSWITRRII